jgi:hypothetical protein
VALRSVVLVPPPGAGGPRSTVVLRPGGPKDKGRAADVVTLVLGVLLLLSCVLLVNALPNKQYALPQFSVTYPDMQTNSTSNRFEFVEGAGDDVRIREFTYDLPGNVHTVTVVTYFADDLAESLPDQFRVEVFNNNGDPIGQRVDYLNSKPTLNATNPFPTYEAGFSQGRLSIPVGIHPEDEIVQGRSHLEVAEQVRARLEPQHRIASEGTWTVRVTLVGAHDCPDPAANDVDRQQALFCRMTASQQGSVPGAEDLRNEFTIENFIYTTYTVKVEDLS